MNARMHSSVYYVVQQCIACALSMHIRRLCHLAIMQAPGCDPWHRLTEPDRSPLKRQADDATWSVLRSVGALNKCGSDGTGANTLDTCVSQRVLRVYILGSAWHRYTLHSIWLAHLVLHTLAVLSDHFNYEVSKYSMF